MLDAKRVEEEQAKVSNLLHLLIRYTIVVQPLNYSEAKYFQFSWP